MANNHNLNINVNHIIKNDAASSIEQVLKDFQTGVDGLTKELSKSNSYRERAQKAADTRAENRAKKTEEAKENIAQTAPSSPNPQNRQFDDTISKFVKAQTRFTDAISTLAKVAVAIPIISNTQQIISGLGQSNYLSARNNLINPLGYAISQTEAEYTAQGGKYGLAGSIIGGALGAVVGGAPGAAFGAQIGNQGAQAAHNYFNAEDLGEKQLNLERSQISTQLSRGTIGDRKLANLYSSAYTEPDKYALYTSQFPNLGAANAYRNNSGSDYLGIAQFNKRYNVEGGAANQSAVLLSQIAGYSSDMSTTLHTIDQYQSKYGGDTIQQLSMIAQLLQAGNSMGSAINTAYKGGYQGAAFQQAQFNYKTADIATRIRQEVISNSLGFSTSRYMRGLASSKELNAIKGLQNKYAAGRETSGASLLGHVLDVMTEGAGIAFTPMNNAMPTNAGFEGLSYDQIPKSTAEMRTINDRIKKNSGTMWDKNYNESQAAKMHEFFNNLQRKAQNNIQEYNFSDMQKAQDSFSKQAAEYRKQNPDQFVGADDDFNRLTHHKAAPEIQKLTHSIDRLNTTIQRNTK